MGGAVVASAASLLLVLVLAGLDSCTADGYPRAWIRQIGTSSNDYLTAMAVAEWDNVLVGGYTDGNLTGTKLGGSDIWFANYSSSGAQEWIVQMGTSTYDSLNAMAVSVDGEVLVGGITYGDLNASYGDLNASHAGEGDIWFAKYSSSGVQEWIVQIGTSSADDLNALAVDSGGNVLVGGSTAGNLTGPGSKAGNLDTWLAKYSSSGAQQWIVQFGTDDFDEITAITVDSGDNVLVGGYTKGALAGSHAGGDDIWLANYSSSGMRKWIVQIGTSSDDKLLVGGNSMAVDSHDNVLIGGSTLGNFTSRSNAGSNDIWFAKYSSSGAQEWIVQIGSSSDDDLNALAVDSGGNVLVGGSTAGNLTGLGSNAGNLDTWLAKYSSSGAQQWIVQNGTSSNDTLYAMAVDSGDNVLAGGQTDGALAGSRSGGIDAWFASYTQPSPTSIPTSTPTLAPSSVPSQAPTARPTMAPSSLPTLTPTLDPTLSPTPLPTLLPTFLPSLLPTHQPTLQPTPAPSPVPSLQPTALPSLLPTLDPTAVPTLEPTLQPTLLPTFGPSHQPTLPPTATPTLQPSPMPSFEPTISPTHLPTLEPTALPTMAPSGLPTMSPTLLPSSLPTIVPSGEPTLLPSLAPSAAPTLLPSFLPTAMPTLDPTSLPTLLPSLLPTATPTLQPFPSPTFNPTGTPGPTTSGTSKVGITMNFVASAAPSASDSDKLKGALVKQLGINSADIRGWTLSFTFGSSSRRLVISSEEESPYSAASIQQYVEPEEMAMAGASGQRRLSGSFTWTSDFTLVTTDSTTTGSQYANSVKNSLNSSSFATTLATSLNTTLSVDTSSLVTDVATRNPSPGPTLIPSLLPTLQPTHQPSPLPTPLPTPLCAAGTYLSGVLCIDCAAGKYSDPSVGTWVMTCVECAIGKFQANTGQSSCGDCDAGHFGASTGLTVSTCSGSCAVGKYSAAGSTACTNCDAGTIAAAAGSSACTKCLAGTIAATAGASACTECTIGTIADSEGATACTDCIGTSGEYIATAGQTACDSCAAGSIVDLETAATSCTPCVGTLGEYIASAGQTACDSCAAGNVVNLESGATTCTACTPGLIAETAGATTCTACTAGKASSGTAAVACETCSAGKYAASAGATSCTNAAAGSYVDTTGATSTIQCQAGEYQDDVGQTACKSCEDFFAGEKNPWYFSLEAGATTCLPCACNNQKTAAVKSCDAATGECFCKGLWLDKELGLNEGFGNDEREAEGRGMDCSDEQKVGRAIKFAYSFFSFFIVFVIPFMFGSGALAVLSGVWRKDVAIILNGLRDSTATANQMEVRRDMSKNQREIEKRLRSAFNNLDSDASGGIDVDELKSIFLLIGLPEDYVFTAMAAADLDNNEAIDADEFHLLISFLAPFVKQQRTRKRHLEIFDVLDDDKSGTIDGDEVQEASELLGISMDQMTGHMETSDAALSYNEFVRVVDRIFSKERHEAVVKARKMKEGHFFATYERLRHKDGSFTFGCFCKSLAAIGLSLSKTERLQLFEVFYAQEKRGASSRDPELAFTHSAKRAPPSASVVHIETADKSRGRWCCKQAVNDLYSHLLTYRDYRLMLSAAVLHYESDYFPRSAYKKAFLSFADDGEADFDGNSGAHRGYIQIAHLSDLFVQVGHPLGDDEVSKLASDLDRGDGLLLFDTFADVMAHFVDTELEVEILEELQDKGRLLRIELFALFLRLAMIPLLAFALMCFGFVTMVFDVYLMSQDFYLHEQKIEERVKTYIAAVAQVFNSLKPLPFYHLLPPLRFSFTLLEIFTVEIPVKAGISCEGMQTSCMLTSVSRTRFYDTLYQPIKATFYLFLNFCVIAILVVLFDSSIFLFLVVSPEEYKLPAGSVLKRFGESGRQIEQAIMKGMFFQAGKSMKTIIQIVMAKMLWSSFIPFWEPFSPACEEKKPGSENVAKYAVSALFWLLALPMLSIILNTAVYGTAPQRIDKMHGKRLEVEKGALSEYYLNPASKSCTIEHFAEKASEEEEEATVNSMWHHIYNARIPDGYRAINNSPEFTFHFYFYACSCMQRFCSVTRCLYQNLIKEIEDTDVSAEELELFDHDPRFWQQHWQFMAYFIKEQSEGSISKGIYKLLVTLAWKGLQLMKMTVGYWDKSLIYNMQIKSRGEKLNLDHSKGETNHESMLANVGLLHSLMWQLLPFCVCVGKAGEALNAAQIYVYDDTAQFTVTAARQHDERENAKANTGTGQDDKERTFKVKPNQLAEMEEEEEEEEVMPVEPQSTPPGKFAAACEACWGTPGAVLIEESSISGSDGGEELSLQVLSEPEYPVREEMMSSLPANTSQEEGGKLEIKIRRVPRQAMKHDGSLHFQYYSNGKKEVGSFEDDVTSLSPVALRAMITKAGLSYTDCKMRSLLKERAGEAQRLVLDGIPKEEREAKEEEHERGDGGFSGEDDDGSNGRGGEDEAAAEPTGGAPAESVSDDEKQYDDGLHFQYYRKGKIEVGSFEDDVDLFSPAALRAMITKAGLSYMDCTERSLLKERAREAQRLVLDGLEGGSDGGGESSREDVELVQTDLLLQAAGEADSSQEATQPHEVEENKQEVAQLQLAVPVKELDDDIYKKTGLKSQASFIRRRQSSVARGGQQELLVFSLEHNDEPKPISRWMMHNMDTGAEEVLFQIQVKADEGSIAGEGMFVWCEEGSRIDLDETKKKTRWLARISVWLHAVHKCLLGKHRNFGEDDMNDKPEEKPCITFYQEMSDNIIRHGHRLNGEEVRHFRSEKPMGQRVKYEADLSGVPGDSLPTAENPLFIPSTCCVVEFSSSGGTGSHFVISACYTSETPIIFSTSWHRRLFRWACNVAEYITKLVLCVVIDPVLQWRAFAFIMIIELVRGIDHALESNDEAVEKRKENSQIQVLYDPEAWRQLFYNTFCFVCHMKWYRRWRAGPQKKSISEQVEVGSQVSAPYSENGEYYDSEVLELSADRRTARLRFLGYGVEEEVQLLRIKPQAPLMPYWTHELDTATNAVYYFNGATGESTWERPARPPLPPGWSEEVDGDSGQTYFWNSANGEASWDVPAGPEFTPPGELAAACGACWGTPGAMVVEENPVSESDDGGVDPPEEFAAACRACWGTADAIGGRAQPAVRYYWGEETMSSLPVNTSQEEERGLERLSRRVPHQAKKYDGSLHFQYYSNGKKEVGSFEDDVTSLSPVALRAMITKAGLPYTDCTERSLLEERASEAQRLVLDDIPKEDAEEEDEEDGDGGEERRRGVGGDSHSGGGGDSDNYTTDEEFAKAPDQTAYVLQKLDDSGLSSEEKEKLIDEMEDADGGIDVKALMKKLGTIAQWEQRISGDNYSTDGSFEDGNEEGAELDRYSGSGDNETVEEESVRVDEGADASQDGTRPYGISDNEQEVAEVQKEDGGLKASSTEAAQTAHGSSPLAQSQPSQARAQRLAVVAAQTRDVSSVVSKWKALGGHHSPEAKLNRLEQRLASLGKKGEAPTGDAPPLGAPASAPAAAETGAQDEAFRVERAKAAAATVEVNVAATAAAPSQRLAVLAAQAHDTSSVVSKWKSLGGHHSPEAKLNRLEQRLSSLGKKTKASTSPDGAPTAAAAAAAAAAVAPPAAPSQRLAVLAAQAHDTSSVVGKWKALGGHHSPEAKLNRLEQRLASLGKKTKARTDDAPPTATAPTPRTRIERGTKRPM